MLNYFASIRLMKYRVIIIFLLFVIPSASFSQSAKSRLEAYFLALQANQQFNGNVLVVENGKTVYERSFGYADFQQKHLNKATTQFPIASISKTLTATAILQLAQAGKLSVSDPAASFLAGFPYPDITIRHLLSHTSGLPPYNAYFDSTWKLYPESVFANSDFLAGLQQHPRTLLYSPGDKGNYDNINYIVLALIIEKVSGMSYPDYINRNILVPAGMKNTKFYPSKFQHTHAEDGKFAFPYLYPHFYSDSLVKANSIKFVVDYWRAYNFSGFGEYISTTRDLVKYDQAYRAGVLLNPSILQEAYQPVLLNSGKNNSANFALGWQVEVDTTFGKIVYHGGAATGLSCVLLRNISREQTIVIFDNTHPNAHEIGTRALHILNGVSVPYPKKSIARIYGRILIDNGPKAAKDSLDIMRKDSMNFYLSEDELNLLGYDFLGGINNPNPFRFPEAHKYEEALETFGLNVLLFPESWNTYDSYGEALLVAGRREEAIAMYKKSIALNPGNEGGKRVLAELTK